MATGKEGAEASLKQNGKTFHWARRFLGDEMGAEAAQLYGFCRILDDMADGDIEDGPKRLTTLYKDLKSNRAITDPDIEMLIPFMEKHDLPRDVVIALIDGLLMDQKPVAVRDQDAVVRYGYHVAGTVGILMCSILTLKPIAGLDEAKAHPAYHHAIDMGIGMQLTNIARDVLEDAQMGRRYLPEPWVNGLSAKDIAKAAATRDEDKIMIVQGAIQKLLGLAEQYYESGMAGLRYLPLRAHLAILIAGRAYRQIGLKLVRQGTNWHDGRVITSTPTKIATSLHALPQMTTRFSALPVHEGAHEGKLHLALKGLPYVHA